MKFRNILLLVCFMLFSIGCQDKSQKDDLKLQADVDSKFEARKEIAKHRKGDLFSVFDSKLSDEESGALKYLFAYMPLNDLADYNGDFFLNQVRISLKSRAELPWGNSIPDDVFRHFVLPYRVNNENLDTFRLAYYNDLKERVQGMGLEEAILEINHWCHEKVSYMGADIRTSSPMNTMKSAHGRCGEESTFTVMALRAVSIPARQVYTPRWAHSDDNHAWVEVWLNGTWQYLGACEPEPSLDMGWFTEPARRAMLVHTKAFGLYNGNEPIVQNASNYGEINTLERYAETKTIYVKVLGENNEPLEGAEVSFNLYNYAEFFPLASIQSNSNGFVSFMTGLGDILVWASKDGNYNFKKISVSGVDTLVLELKKSPIEEAQYNWDLEPPKLRDPLPVSSEGREENNSRLKQEDSIRTDYISSFIETESASSIAEKVGLEPGIVKELFKKSEGNYSEIKKYLESLKESDKVDAINLLKQVSDKDLRDVPAFIFLDHLHNAIANTDYLSGNDHQFYLEYVLSPRVSNELLTDYRKFLQNAFIKGDNTKPTPAQLIVWIDDNILLNETDNYYDVPITPVGVYNLKVSDKYSRKIFFVALCRSLGIPARLNMEFQIPQYYQNEEWHNAYFLEDKIYSQKTGTISFENENSTMVPGYHIHYTLAHISEGKYKTIFLGFGNKNTFFLEPLTLPVGEYMLITGNRMGDGSVLNTTRFFRLKEDEKKVIPVKLRENERENADYGSFDIEQKVQNFTNEAISLKNVISGDKAIVIWIDPDREPSKHVLKDIPLLKDDFEQWDGKLVFLVPSNKLTASFDPAKYYDLPENSEFYIDHESELLISASEVLKKDVSANLPLILILDKNTIRYYSGGYKIGIGEQLVKNIK
ncbi:MAG: transglutaminase-like domain-containing protein [Bacteroidales bacterium]|nr:transglutaminase-like domain-containing protein [Bacteroidales bacterium]